MNGTKLILDDHGNNLDSFRISLESFRSFKGPLLQTSNLSGSIFCRFLQQTSSRVSKGRDVPLSLCPRTKIFPCSAVPLSLDKGRRKNPGTNSTNRKLKSFFSFESYNHFEKSTSFRKSTFFPFVSQ